MVGELLSMEIHLAYKEPKEMVAVSTWNGW